MSWFGRQLRTYSKNGISANFMYDADGLRSAKGVNGVKTTYQYVGDKLYYEKIGNDKTLYYFYDSYGNLANIYYTCGTSSAIYHVATNSQGDVIAPYNFAGKKVGAYDYDAWGNTRVFVVTQDENNKNVHTQIDPETQYLNHIVNVNPIRYRGYYYDSDLDLYYLQSRYYDSEIGRIINADGYITTGQGVLSYNMFAYCLNNPVNLVDYTGTCVLGVPYSDGRYCAVCNPVKYPSNLREFLFGVPNTNNNQQLMVPASNPSNDIFVIPLSETNDALYAMGESVNVVMMQIDHHLLIQPTQYGETLNNIWGYGLVGVDTACGMYENYTIGASNGKIAWDATVDVVINGTGVYMSSTIGGYIGAACGSAFPVIGTAGGYIVGMLAGFLVGDLYNFFAEEPKSYLKGLVE